MLPVLMESAKNSILRSPPYQHSLTAQSAKQPIIYPPPTSPTPLDLVGSAKNPIKTTLPVLVKLAKNTILHCPLYKHSLT